MTPCFCGRAPRGFAFHDFNIAVMDRRPIEHCCSMACLDIIWENKGMAPNRDEERATAQASEAVGEYLERIGKTDLAAMTPDEWAGFIAHTFACVAAEVRNICAEDTPF
jgi:hypothetical protein